MAWSKAPVVSPWEVGPRALEQERRERRRRTVRGALFGLVAYSVVVAVVFATPGLRASVLRLTTPTSNDGALPIDIAKRSPANPPSSVNKRFGSPARIVVEAADVDARVVGLGLNPNGTLQVPSNYETVGWYREGVRPGEPGAAVLVGHVDSETSPGVFSDLDGLEYGDVIEIVDAAGRKLRFTVEYANSYAKNAFPTEFVYGSTDGRAELRLITCAGPFDPIEDRYVDNYVVFATVDF